MVAPDPNVSTLTAAGLTIESNSDIVAYITSQFQLIYGADVNFDSNSPDGQAIQIFAQAITDYLETVADTYSGFSVENAYGTCLDQLVAMNGIARKQGTFTGPFVAVTASSAVNLTDTPLGSAKRASASLI